MESFTPIKKYEVSPSDQANFDEIEKIKEELTDRAFDALDSIPVGSEAPKGLSPGLEFSKFLQDKMSEVGIDENPEEFAAYHYIKGSSPSPEKIKSFDLEGNFIFESYKEFAGNFLIEPILSVQ
ncbi:MAG: hypothetical protein KBD10_01380 [Candidatus Pacebacteria bacterium]|nr:hypothetical protein [Candidatus Paceibacterota bacterium]